MIARVEPGLLSGTVRVPSSKSALHRLLIAAALADGPTDIGVDGINADIEATISCLRALGCGIEYGEERIHVQPVRGDGHPQVLLDCRESGSTLRFLLPVAAVLGAEARFVGSGRLPSRPNRVLTDALEAHGVQLSGDLLPIELSGKLHGGEYAISGSVSSQYITGLLFALPLCEEDSTIRLITPLQSASYVDMTLDALSAFGVEAVPTGDGWHIPGAQRYRSPGTVEAERDWSSACFWLAANHLGSRIECPGLSAQSRQGDRRFAEQLTALGGAIDVSSTPDAVPALAVAAALHPGRTSIVGAGRLRFKESDRLEAVRDMLHQLGGSAEVEEDGLDISGVTRLTGGTVDGRNDHRIVMAAAVAATRADGPVFIRDAEAVAKSYPRFFEDFAALGGHVYVE